MSDDQWIGAVMNLLAVVVGGLVTYVSTSKLSAAQSKRESERAILTERLKVQSEAIAKFVELVTKWETKPVRAMMTKEGKRLVDQNRLGEEIAEAHRDGGALFAMLSASFRGVGFVTEARSPRHSPVAEPGAGDSSFDPGPQPRVGGRPDRGRRCSEPVCRQA